MLLAIPKQKNRLNSDYYLLSVFHWGPCVLLLMSSFHQSHQFSTYSSLHYMDVMKQSILISATTQMEHTLYTNKKMSKTSESKLPTAFHQLIKY